VSARGAIATGGAAKAGQGCTARSVSGIFPPVFPPPRRYGLDVQVPPRCVFSVG
jgi:hypothetical protein